MNVHGIPMVFHHYLFESALRPVHVFYSLSDPGGIPDVEFRSDLTVKGRISAALAGRRNAGRAVVELLLTGAANDEVAVRALRKVLDGIVSPVPAAGEHAPAAGS